MGLPGLNGSDAVAYHLVMNAFLAGFMSELEKCALGDTSFGSAIRNRDAMLGRRRQPTKPRISRSTGAATYRRQTPRKAEGAKVASGGDVTA